MDENDLFALAQQTGMVAPGEGQGLGQDTPSYADQFNYAPPQAPQQGDEPQSPGYTDEDILAHFVPQGDQGGLFGNAPTLSAPEGMPPDEILLAAPPNLGSVKQGASVSNSGYSDAKNQQVRKGPGAALDNQIAGIKGANKEEEAVRQGRIIDANTEAQEAAHGEAIANADLLTADGHEKAILAQLGQAHDTKTEGMIAAKQAEAQAAKAQFVAAYNDFRASKVDPSQLWGNMTGGQHFGVLVSSFVQDYLGAKGIKTSAMDIFNKAIDRNIDAQIKNISIKGQAAEGFKALWDMSMQESHSIGEARARMRVFMLDSAKTAVESHLAQFNAALATAKGRAGVAKLDQELAKAMNEVSSHIDSKTATEIQAAITRYGDDLKASMESARIAVDRERNQIERNKSNPAALNPWQNLIYDTTQSGGGHARWEFDDPSNPKNREFLEQQGKVGNLLDLQREYRSLTRRFGNQGATAGTRWSNSDTERARAVAMEIVSLHSLELTGKASNEQEAKRIASMTPQQLFSGSLNIQPIIAQTENHMRARLDTARKQIAHDLHPGDQRRNLVKENTSFGEAEKSEANDIAEGEDLRKSVDQLIRDNQIKDLEKHRKYQDVGNEVGADVKENHKAFMERHPDIAGGIGDVPVGKARVFDGAGGYVDVPADKADEFKKKGNVVRVGAPAGKIMVFERGLTRIKDLAQKGIDLANEADTPEDKKFAKAKFDENVAILRHEADSVLSGIDPDDPVGRYAVYMLEKLGVDTTTVSNRGEEPTIETSGTAHETMPAEPPPEHTLPPLPSRRRK